MYPDSNSLNIPFINNISLLKQTTSLKKNFGKANAKERGSLKSGLTGLKFLINMLVFFNKHSKHVDHT